MMYLLMRFRLLFSGISEATLFSEKARALPRLTIHGILVLVRHSY